MDIRTGSVRVISLIVRYVNIVTLCSTAEPAPWFPACRLMSITRKSGVRMKTRTNRRIPSLRNARKWNVQGIATVYDRTLLIYGMTEITYHMRIPVARLA